MAPYFIHPTTGEHITLRVEDYCPYIDDHGGTFPTDVAAVANACCCIRRTAATASFARRATGSATTLSSSSVADAVSCSSHVQLPVAGSAYTCLKPHGNLYVTPTVPASVHVDSLAFSYSF